MTLPKSEKCEYIIELKKPLHLMASVVGMAGKKGSVILLLDCCIDHRLAHTIRIYTKLAKR